jgi:hypothetical protein
MSEVENHSSNEISSNESYETDQCEVTDAQNSGATKKRKVTRNQQT